MSIITSKYTMTSINKNDTSKTATLDLNIPTLSDTCKIMDSRTLKDFKNQTFGGYNISKASSALEKAIFEDKIEPALHWALQLFLSGLITQLWNKLLSLASKSINIYNPKLPEFLYNKNQQWEAIVNNKKYAKENVLVLRNHPTIRLLLAELISVLVLSRKHKLYTLPKIKKNEFIIDIFKSKLEAKNNKLIEKIIQNEDPSEIRIAINEMAYHMYNKNSNKTLYWLSWIVEWEKINSKKYGKYECALRPIQGVDAKYFKDVVWLIWEVVNNIAKLKCSYTTTTEWNKQIQNLWGLYINNFTPSSRTKKQNYIVWSILYITETIDYVIPLIDRPELLFQNLLGFDKIIVSLKSQQVIHNTTNNKLMNVVVENNYMKPENYEELEKKKQQQHHLKLQAEKEHLAKQKKINVESLDKLTEISKLDKYLFA